jgi:uncharacterized protein (DUF885 family)
MGLIESLGKKLGLYTDPYQYFGMLGNEMHRAVRLVVDTGIHSKGWTREQAIQFSMAKESEAAITTEIERYMAIPGQALSYNWPVENHGIDKEHKQNGVKFDIRKFHEKCLNQA